MSLLHKNKCFCNSYTHLYGLTYIEKKYSYFSILSSIYYVPSICNPILNLPISLNFSVFWFPNFLISDFRFRIFPFPVFQVFPEFSVFPNVTIFRYRARQRNIHFIQIYSFFISLLKIMWDVFWTFQTFIHNQKRRKLPVKYLL